MPPGAPRLTGKDAVHYFWPNSASERRAPAPDHKFDAHLAAARASLLALKRQIAALAFELKFRRLLREKAYNPNQPRVPAGNPDGGQWTSGSGTARVVGRTDRRVISDASPEGEWKPGAQYAANRPRGIGHNQGPPLNEPPSIPKVRPPTIQAENKIAKAAAQFLARAVRLGTPSGLFLSAMQEISWLENHQPNIDALQDPPKSLEELQQAAFDAKPGYHIHHIVEQKLARDFGFPEAMINGPENRVRIPRYKHEDINGWYSRPNDKFNGLSPRDYLRDKDWPERIKIGLEALRRFEVLKP